MNKDYYYVCYLIAKRDGISLAEAIAAVDQFLDGVHELIDSGGSIQEIEDYLLDELGLEPDYLEYLLW